MSQYINWLSYCTFMREQWAGLFYLKWGTIGIGLWEERNIRAQRSVELVCGEGTLGLVCGEGTLGLVCGEGTLGLVCGEGTLKLVCGEGTLGLVCGEGTLGLVGREGTLGLVCGEGASRPIIARRKQIRTFTSIQPPQI